MDQKARHLQLYYRMKAGDKRARELLIEENMGLVYGPLFNRFRYMLNQREEDDLVQAGMLGLIRAVDGWDPALGMLSTYAYRWILQSFQREKNHKQGAKMPAHVQTYISLLMGKTNGELGDRDPDRLSLETGIEVNKVRNAITFLDFDSAIVSGDLLQESGITATTPSHENAAIARLDGANEIDLYERVAGWGTYDGRALILYYGLHPKDPAEHVLDELSYALGTTKEKTRLHLKAGMKRLAAELGGDASELFGEVDE